ncbi:uncharacterized protein LOC129607820 [Condylostylus longicornis]|uniref:uncharacterized protein LOC129607820 n=1 Tax=Condylostylus longicornis TaxID=2530218 RepID=UPI00244E3D8E|nr:uncharacterized protein LOC129607820 [Condylostylus longicornis]XP_055374982.1 uncharacterized protein LOC129607820 [Condylostylus longicornis]
MNYTKDELAAVAHFYMDHLKNAPPEVRNILLYLAKNAYDNNDIEKAVYFHAKALCNTFDSRNIFEINSLDSYGDTFLEDVIFPKHFKAKKSKSNPLLDFANENFPIAEVKYANRDFTSDFDITEKVLEMKSSIKDMPEEWMVLQITKDYNEYMSLKTREENVTSKLPIYLSILKHSADNILDNFICIKIEFSDCELFKNFFEIQENFKALSSDSLSLNNCDEKLKLKYLKKILPLENQIIASIAKLEKELGPWVCLFSGNLENKEIEREILHKVGTFCKKCKLDNNTSIILGLLLKEPKKLIEENCRIASEYLADGRSKRIKSLLYEFLKEMSAELSNKDMKSKKPCLLIIDELLDNFPWEFLNKSQEFCRISSLNILNKIFCKHKSKINKGYLEISVKYGHFLVNPQNNLKDSENRIREFGRYWLPNYDFTFGKQPSQEKIKEIFNSNGIYVYCGHGHGMDYLNPHKLHIAEIKNPVVFLFGCESVKLSSKTSYGEMTGEHLYFHKGLCPAVIGCIHIAFDYSLDIIATEILSTWISSKQKPHWSCIDFQLWRKGKIVPSQKNSKTKQIQYEPRLAAILSKIRSKGSQKYYHLIPLVYRGIPVWNSELGK